MLYRANLYAYLPRFIDEGGPADLDGAITRSLDEIDFAAVLSNPRQDVGRARHWADAEHNSIAFRQIKSPAQPNAIHRAWQHFIHRSGPALWFIMMPQLVDRISVTAFLLDSRNRPKAFQQDSLEPEAYLIKHTE